MATAYTRALGKKVDLASSEDPENRETAARTLLDPGIDWWGWRVPIGLDFDLNNVPLDFFVQFVPTLDFFHNYAPHSVYLDIDFSVGIRFWFS